MYIIVIPPYIRYNKKVYIALNIKRNMIRETLQKIGLTDGEIKVYLSLLELGSTTTWNITKKSKVSGSKVYEVLDRLIGKGMVSLVTKNNVKYFEASSPERILDYLDEKGEEIEEEKLSIQKIIPELILKKKEAKTSEVKVFTGWEGMKTANEDIIDTLKRGETWLEMGITEQPKLWEAYFNRKQKERAKKGIIHKSLLNIKYQQLYIARKNLPHTELRFLPKKFEMPTSIEIYKNKVSIFILLKEAPTVILIENEAVSDSFRKYFHALWKSAKK